ncbi:MAG: Lipopolysaccharide assembly protein B [Pseudomonas delhiensis]|nr:MAG: Lipopolysaccharide assembly protein B [Pseudomonas delhiensis]
MLENQSDDSLERLSRELPLTPETLPSHLQVGNLFRRRGDLQKALSIHEQLLASVEGGLLRGQVRLELARDFIAAGLLGRAEPLLDELMECADSTSIAGAAVDELRRIAERERDWARAIALAKRILPGRSELNTVLAHYHCELAGQRLRQGHLEAARQNLDEAGQIDPDNPRIWWMRMECELAVKGSADVLPLLEKLLLLAPGMAGVVAESLMRSEVAHAPALHEALAGWVERDSIGDAALLVLLRLQPRWAWRDDWLRRIQRQPSWPSVLAFLDALDGQPVTASEFDALQPLLSDLSKTTPRWRCSHCGFSGRELHWQCPSCHRWGALRPLKRPS